MIETIKSTKILSKEGFKVMVYCTDDPILAKKLEDNGAAAIMPLASPIGSGLGIQNNKYFINYKTIKSSCYHRCGSRNCLRCYCSYGNGL